MRTAGTSCGHGLREGYCPQYTTGRGWSGGHGNKDSLKDDRETSCSIPQEVKRDAACSKPRAATGRRGDSLVFDTGERDEGRVMMIAGTSCGCCTREGYRPQYTAGRGWSGGRGNKDPLKDDRETSCSTPWEVKRDAACSKLRAATG